jgi:dipeptidyl aminopeptidase/acylaminoacyl peptidase
VARARLNAQALARLTSRPDRLYVGRIRRPALAACLVLVALLVAAPAAGAQPGRILFDVPYQGNEKFAPGAFVIGADGRRVQRLPSSLGGPKLDGSDLGSESDWTTDGSRIAFTRGRELLAARSDGRGRRRLAVGPRSDVQPSKPAWSPGGDQVAFSMTDFPNRNDQVFLVSGSGGQPRMLRTDQFLLQPSWAPDGTRLVAFGANPQGDQRGLWVVDVATAATSLLHPESSVVEAPAWSPTGGLIAYIRTSPENVKQLWVVGSDGSGARLLVGSLPYLGKPVWSPDGSTLAFASARGIYTLRPDGSGLRLLYRVRDPILSDWVTGSLRRLRPTARTAVVRVLRGTVRIRRRVPRRFGGKGLVRTIAKAEERLPYGTLVDARRGRVLISRRAGGGRIRSAVRTGRFKVERK